MVVVIETALSPVMLVVVVSYKGASVFGKAVVKENGGKVVIC